MKRIGNRGLRWRVAAEIRMVRANRRREAQRQAFVALRTAKTEAARWRDRANLFLECELERRPGDKQIHVSWAVDSSTLRTFGPEKTVKTAAAFLFRELAPLHGT